MSWWRSLLPKRASETQMNSELRFHIEELTEENMAAGMTPAEARRRAQMDFGGQENFKEQVREVYRIRVWDAGVANLKSAIRFIRKSPTFSVAVILTLALAIGANSAVFSAIDAILLKPLPFPEADRLVLVGQRKAKGPAALTRVAPVRVDDWNRLSSTFEGLTGYYTEDVSETTGALPEKVTRAWVYTRFFQVWGVVPALGREFSPEEETPRGPNAVLISDRFWHSRFHADPNVIGKNLRLDGGLYPIVGVMPPSFRFDRETELWSPLPPGLSFGRARENNWFVVTGRLKAGVTAAQAHADLATVQAQLGRQFPDTDGDLSVTVDPLKETTVAGSRRSLWLLFGSVSLLLLIACTNIVALLLSRAAQRQHEVSVRFSLGASRGALIAQLLTETFLLALIGSVLGLALASGASGLFRSLATGLPRVEEIRLDARIVLYALACSVVVTFLCGLVPAIRGTRRSLSVALAQTSRSQVPGRHPLQWLLVGVQVALAVTLLAGAGLLLRSFQELGRVSPGFDPSRILAFQLSMNWGETGDMKKLRAFTDHVLETLRATPGVEAAAISVGAPGVPFNYQTELKLLEGRAESEPKLITQSRFVSASYFATMQIPMLAGNVCRETADGPPTVVVNRAFADAYFSGVPVMGHHVQSVELGYSGPAEIVGISGDVRESGLDHAPVPTAYWCAPVAEPGTFFLVRTRNNPSSMGETIRRQLRDIEPTRSVYDIAPLEQHFSDALSENRMRTVLLTFFAATALALACIGLYGTLSYNVNVRQREVGLRLALGALRGQIVKQFLWQGLMVCLLGCMVGFGLAAASSRALAGLLYGVSPNDAPTLSGVILLVLMVAAAACLLPSIRASRVEPMRVLREE